LGSGWQRYGRLRGDNEQALMLPPRSVFGAIRDASEEKFRNHGD
jgi:hypothetical protein